ncbi:hypothetical protein [Clostridium tetani]|uniref:Uncharacterized protein n=1 Tax=Clostridium tetani TaxID=1513 RepID=A0A4Q0VFD4_CLOTA|nr:hypothetical protein [Clostridium tetani]RXI44228.1 hypothetical protein DP126_12105 [Clostridium tetani]RXI50715.1 hypothetical protein DP130_01755 [Clostridium tetani]RXM59387.1 hypothetical protein DP138_13860 [Clostridium tetani]RXM65105.1 hypothetical protein DP145_11130 [Clostridium tetani]BDR66752.1 hypothetical protein K144312032_09800 [Clostridium tetani]
MSTIKKNTTLIVLLEKISVITITIILAYITHYYKFNIFAFKEKESLFSNILSFVSILLGIVITMATLFLGYSNKQVVKKIKAKSADKLMFRYFLVPIITGIIASIGSIYFALISGEEVLTNLVELKLTIFYIIILSIFFLSTIRVFFLMLMILKDVFEEDINKQEDESRINKDIEVNFDNDVFK